MTVEMTVSFKISFLISIINGHVSLFELLLFSTHTFSFAILSILHLFIMHAYRIPLLQSVMPVKQVQASIYDMSNFESILLYA